MVMQPALAMFQDDPWLTKIAAEFEAFEAHSEEVLEWDIDLWSGRDLHKFWLKTSGEFEGSERDGDVELAYSQAWSAYWDWQVGVRRDFSSDDSELSDSRSWASIGVLGTAPYFIDVDARFFVGEASSTQLLVELEKEWMLTQEWVVVSELDIIANGSTNEDFLEGAGLSEVEFSVRLGYEHNGNRHLQPFLGLATQQFFGTTKTLQREAGEQTSDTRLIAGLEFWF